LYHFSSLLLAALRQKATGLLGQSSFDFLVTGMDDGYFALYQLAQLGGHPLLTPFPVVLTEPTQSVDNDLAAYLGAWIHYLTSQALSGYFLSDCYFILKFVAGLHSSLSSIGIDLERQIDHPRFDNHPLPFDFTPAHLWVRLQQHAQFIGYRGAILTAPRDTQHPAPIHQLLSSLFSPDDDSSFSMDHLLAALSSTSTTCFFCHNTCHTAEACPLLLWTKSDPFAKRIVLHLLQDLPLKTTRTMESHSSLTSVRKPPMHKPFAHTSPCVHALGLDADVPPDDPDNPDDIFVDDYPVTSDPLPLDSFPTPNLDGDLDF